MRKLGQNAHHAKIFFIFQEGNVEHLEKEKDNTSSIELNISPSTETKETQDTGTGNFV